MRILKRRFFFFKHSVLPLLIRYGEGEHEIQFFFFTFLTLLFSTWFAAPLSPPLSPLFLCSIGLWPSE